jgi:glycosyltransferase involved in cell wall biosynthesis
MKIAMIGTSLFHQGAEYVLAAQARGLSKHGHYVAVILSKYHGDWQKEHQDWESFELGPAVKVIVLPTRRGRESVFSLRKVLKSGGFDVVLNHTASFCYPMIASAILMRNRPALINVEHLGGIGVDAKGRKIEPRSTLRARLFQMFKRRLDAQFTVSEGTADAITRMTGFPRSRIYTVYNPGVDDVFERKRKETPAHPWLREATLPVVVAAGAFAACKNHVLLLHAWAEVIKRFNARLIIFGEGGLRSEYERLIEELGIGDSVSLPGFTNNLPAELKGGACFVVSSLIESFSVVLVEALASGVPVVSTDCPYGPGEILKRGKYGTLVKNDDATALTEGILKVLNGEGIRPPPESYAPFTIDAVVGRYERAMEDVLDKRKVKR